MRRGVLARDTQIIMKSVTDSRSAGVRMLSRWSGTPSSTPVSQVPQVPSSQEDSTSIPAARSAARTDTSAGTSTTRPELASSTWKGAEDSDYATGRNRSRCSAASGQRSATARSSGSGPQQ